MSFSRLYFYLKVVQSFNQTFLCKFLRSLLITFLQNAPWIIYFSLSLVNFINYSTTISYKVIRARERAQVVC